VRREGGAFLVRAAPGKAGEPLTVIVNWPALLKKERRHDGSRRITPEPRGAGFGPKSPKWLNWRVRLVQ